MNFKMQHEKNPIYFIVSEHKCKHVHFLCIFSAVSYPTPIPLLLSRALILQLIPHRTAYKIRP